jgi:hypothetical protein
LQLTVRLVDRAEQLGEARLLVDRKNAREFLAKHFEVARREKTDGNDPLV